MARLIDADLFRKEIECCDIETSNDWMTIVEQLKEAKTVDAVEVVHGRWVWRDGCFHCTNCKYTEDHITNYCPNCGADMRGDGNG